MIKIVDTGTGKAPVVFCDWCDKPITEVGMAAVIYGKTDESGTCSAWHAHKRTCHDNLEVVHSGRHSHLGWVEMGSYLYQLAYNTGFTVEKMAEKDRLDGEMKV